MCVIYSTILSLAFKKILSIRQKICINACFLSINIKRLNTRNKGTCKNIQNKTNNIYIAMKHGLFSGFRYGCETW